MCRLRALTCPASYLLIQTSSRSISSWLCLGQLLYMYFACSGYRVLSGLACMDRSHMESNTLQLSSTRGNHQKFKSVAGPGAAAASGAPSPCAARSSGAAGGRRNPCHTGLQQEDAGTGASASSAGSVLSSQMHSCHAKLFRQVSNACPQVAEHLRRKADVLGQLPCGQGAGCQAGGRASNACSSMRQLLCIGIHGRWLLLHAALRHCVSWRLAALSDKMLPCLVLELSSLRTDC